MKAAQHAFERCGAENRVFYNRLDFRTSKDYDFWFPGQGGGLSPPPSLPRGATIVVVLKLPTLGAGQRRVFSRILVFCAFVSQLALSAEIIYSQQN